MLIDWFTVLAQALNFLILVWLMKRFLYRPILFAIDTRETRIAAEIADAKAKLDEANKQSEIYQKKSAAIDQQRASLLQKACDDAAMEGERLLDEAKKAADALAAKRRQALIDETKRLSSSIARQTSDEVFAIARKALTDLASADLEERIVALFLRRLAGLNAKAKDAMGEAFKSAQDPAVVRCSFDLPPGQRLLIEKALGDTFATTIRVTYQTAPDLIAGLDLSANGQKISWNIANYLSTLESSVAALPPKPVKAAAKRKPTKVA